MIRRVPAIGGCDIALRDRYEEAVAFIKAERKGGRQAIGTAFIVTLPARNGPPFRYLVTAAHISHGERKTWVRFTLADGSIREQCVPRWVPHESTDVAVAPIERGHISGLALTSIPFAALAPREEHRPVLGDRIYFLGLLEPYVEKMAGRLVPIVRSGTIAALHQENFPLKLRGRETEVEVHLVDCRSHKGFSGAPCFYQQDNVLIPNWEAGSTYEGQFGDHGTVTPLLGLVTAHFDSWESVEGKDGPLQSVRSKMNSGIGIIIPAEKIVEVLLMDELAQDRNDEEDENLGPKYEVSLDSVETDENEFDRFEALARKLANTPKPEKDDGNQ